MIAYAACVASQQKFDTICRPGIARAFRDGDMLIQAQSDHSIFEAYNEVLDAVRDRDDLDALVLLHEDTEILSRSFAPLALAALRNPDIAIIGGVGGVGQQGMAWWRGTIVGWLEATNPDHTPRVLTGDVDGLDGCILVLSPWSARHLRFDDEHFTGFDGYDADICRQALAAGKRVRCTPLPVAHRHDRDGRDRVADDHQSFQRADAAFRLKWEPDAGASPRSAADREDAQRTWNAPLADLVPPGARRILDVGEDLAGRADALRAAHTEAEVVQAPTLAGAPPGERFDVVVLADALERTHAPEAVIAHAREVAAPGGTVVFGVPNIGSFPHAMGTLELGSDPAGWAFPESADTPLRPFTLSEVLALCERTGLEPSMLTRSEYDVSGGAGPIRDAAEAARDAAEDAYPRGVATTVQRLTSLRLFAAARISGDAPVAPSVPRLGGVVDEVLLDLLDAGARRVARLDLALAPGGDVAADDAIAHAVAQHTDGPYDAVVMGTALDHVRHVGKALRAVRGLIAPEGAVLATVTNLLRYDLYGRLLERDAWTYGEGPLAHYPVKLYTHFDVPNHAADGGLYVDRVEDEPLDADPRGVATWARVAGEMGYHTDIEGTTTVARMRVVMRHPGP